MIVYSDGDKKQSIEQYGGEHHGGRGCNSDNLQLSGLMKKRTNRTNAWLSCNLRLDEIKNKEQTFTITGWINCVWKEPTNSELYHSLLKYSSKPSDKSHNNESDAEKIIKGLLNEKNVWWYKDNSVTNKNENDDGMRMRILDLRDADQISYYLPIDSMRIFYPSSHKFSQHRDPPYLIFNPRNGMIRTAYHVKAVLSDLFDLYWFPFDKQCLNIKIRWNKVHYHLLEWTNKNDNIIPIKEQWFDSNKIKQKYYNVPLIFHVVEELQHDLEMHDPHADFNINYHNDIVDECSCTGLRFAVISLRFTRNSGYYVSYILFPFFIIVLCSFSIYAIPRDDIVNRLNVSVTILLCFTAFQNITSTELPSTCEMEFIDIYIIIAYILQMTIIGGSIVSSFAQYEYNDDFLFNWNLINEESAMIIDIVIGILLFLCWCIISIIYIFCNRALTFKSCCYNKNDIKQYWINKETSSKNAWENSKNVVTIYSNPK